MRNWKADFEAMNRKAGEGLRVAREHIGMKRETLASHLSMTVDELRQCEQGDLPIDAARLYYADMMFRSGYAYYFHPYCQPELLNNPMENVIRFPSLAIIAGIDE